MRRKRTHFLSVFRYTVLFLKTSYIWYHILDFISSKKAPDAYKNISVFQSHTKMTSFSHRQWQDAPLFTAQEKLFEHLLAERNLSTPEDIQKFLFPTIHDLHDPWSMKGMKKAVNRIYQALKSKERIIIYGDFDTDGITSTVILMQGLKDLGGNVSYRIPDRNTDSHGLKKHILDEIAHKEVSLVITCDCGINDEQEMIHAQNLNLDLIITDHHEPDESIQKRPCLAILNPLYDNCQYPEKNLAGAGVALKLLHAIAQKHQPKLISESLDTWILKYLEIAAVGLIGDCVPLVGECRIITKLGLEKMKNTSWPGLKALLKHTKIDTRTLDEQSIGFGIAPRLNASSRIGDVKTASQLFLGTPKHHTTRIQKLEILNEKRKELTHSSFTQSLTQVRIDAPFQLLQHDDWEPGILGLVAARHSENLEVPVVACTRRDDGKIGASCRAPEGFSMIGALQKHPQLFQNFGGHDGAAGFITEPKNLNKIQEALDQYFLTQKALQKGIPCTAYLTGNLIQFEFVDFLRSLNPFGPGNPEPIFGLRGIEVLDFQMVGKLKNHLKMTITHEDKIHHCIAFFAEKFIDHIHAGQKLDILCTISDSYWNDQRRLEIRIKDLKPTKS